MSDVEGDLKENRIVIGVFKSEIERFNPLDPDIRRYDESVDDIILGIYCVAGIIGLV